MLNNETLFNCDHINDDEFDFADFFNPCMVIDLHLVRIKLDHELH